MELCNGKMEGKNNATTTWTLSLLKKLESLAKSIKYVKQTSPLSWCRLYTKLVLMEPKKQGTWYTVHYNKFEALLSNVDEQQHSIRDAMKENGI
jgi:hypothetical protein